MRGVLKEQIANGLSDEEIMNYWTLRFGERINTNPQDTNPFLLLIPIFFGALFAYIFFKKVRND
jgi:cytochrome c-type biogenesis protein CcmH/NrfF